MIRRILCHGMVCRPALQVLAAASSALVATSAVADTAAPQPNLLRAPAPWLGMLVMFLLMAMVIGVSLMPSRRSHQD